MQSASDHLVTQVTSSSERLGPGAGPVSAPDSVLVALYTGWEPWNKQGSMFSSQACEGRAQRVCGHRVPNAWHEAPAVLPQ